MADVTTGEPRLARPSDAEAAIRTLGEAFWSDPMVWWPLRSEPDLTMSLAMFGRWVPPLIEAGILWLVEDGLGVATWIGPAQRDEYVAVETAVSAGIGEFSDDGGARYAAFWEWAVGQVPEEPCWFLDMFAVRPGQQGRGLGTSLMNHGLRRADRQGLAAFLETSRAENVDLYESFGFEVMAREHAPSGGPEIWFMRREPERGRLGG